MNHTHNSPGGNNSGGPRLLTSAVHKNATLLPRVMELAVKKTSCQSASPLFPLPGACAFQILGAATDQKVSLMETQRELRETALHPKLKH